MAMDVIGDILSMCCKLNKKRLCEGSDAVEPLFEIYLVCYNEKRKNERMVIILVLIILCFFFNIFFHFTV